MQVQKILKNKIFLKGLEKISDHGTSFFAATSLIMSSSVRPLAITLTPDTEKENKQYAIANSISSGIIKFGIVESIALPLELIIKKINKNPEEYLKPKTLERLSPRAYELITQTLKLGVGFITAIPKSILTVALIPIIMDSLFKKSLKLSSEKEKQIQTSNSPKDIKFTGLTSAVGKVIDNNKVQNLAIKYQNQDKDIAKHITAMTDVLLTSTSVIQTNRSKDIKENRKKALNYNNIISTGVTLAGGYTIDKIIKSKTKSFIENFKKLHSNDPNLTKYVEGINILRPALIFAFIYYAILPIFSTYMAEKIDKFVNKK